MQSEKMGHGKGGVLMSFLKLKLKLVKVAISFCGLILIGGISGIVFLISSGDIDFTVLILTIIMLVITLLLGSKCVDAEKRIKKRLEEQ